MIKIHLYPPVLHQYTRRRELFSFVGASGSDFKVECISYDCSENESSCNMRNAHRKQIWWSLCSQLKSNKVLTNKIKEIGSDKSDFLI